MYWLMSLVGAGFVAVVLALAFGAFFGRDETLSAPEIDEVLQRHRRNLEQSAITAEAVRSVQFTQSLRGYQPAEVDAYLERVAYRIAELETRLAAVDRPKETR